MQAFSCKSPGPPENAKEIYSPFQGSLGLISKNQLAQEVICITFAVPFTTWGDGALRVN